MCNRSSELDSNVVEEVWVSEKKLYRVDPIQIKISFIFSVCSDEWNLFSGNASETDWCSIYIDYEPGNYNWVLVSDGFD